MKPIAIIPARGGSKRIPRKNIRNFDGKPVISYAINAAIKSGIFDRVMVSTDDREIADVAQYFGAEIPFFRSAEKSNDFATTVEVLQEVILEYSKLNIQFESACCIYPVNPFVTSDLLFEANKKFTKDNYDSLFTAVRYDFPVQRSFYFREGKIDFLYPEHINTRSQDLEPVFHDAGQFYFFKTKIVQEAGKLFTGNSGIIEIPQTQAQDIDTLTDWELAEIKYQRMKKS